MCPVFLGLVFRHFKSTGFVVMTCLITKTYMTTTHRIVINWRAVTTPRRGRPSSWTLLNWCLDTTELSYFAFNLASPLLETGSFWKEDEVITKSASVGFHDSICWWWDLLYGTSVNHVCQYRLYISQKAGKCGVFFFTKGQSSGAALLSSRIHLKNSVTRVFVL